MYNSKDYAGFVFGMASIACWLVAQLPQFYSNFRSGSAEGLSPWFLAEWLLGDTFNLLGCLMTGDQLPSEVYTAAYFMCVDVVMIFQFVYYTLRSREALGIITSIGIHFVVLVFWQLEPDGSTVLQATGCSARHASKDARAQMYEWRDHSGLHAACQFEAPDH